MIAGEYRELPASLDKSVRHTVAGVYGRWCDDARVRGVVLLCELSGLNGRSLSGG